MMMMRSRLLGPAGPPRRPAGPSLLRLALGLGCVLGAVLSAAPAAARLQVVTTLPDFAALASELGGARVQAEALILGTEDPHFVDPKPSFALRLHRADLFIGTGLGLESGWLPVLLTQARNPAVRPGAPGHLDASRFVRLLEVNAPVDRALGDVHGGGNPHYYLSPVELVAVARGIHERLVQLDPAGKAEYERRWQEFAARAQARQAVWRAKLAPLAGARVVEYHRSWSYLLGWAGLQSVGALEPKPGIPPSPGHVAQLLAQLQGTPVRFVLQEIYHSDSLTPLFAQRLGARRLVLPTMVGSEPGLRTVWDKFDRIVQLLTEPGR